MSLENTPKVDYTTGDGVTTDALNDINKNLIALEDSKIEDGYIELDTHTSASSSASTYYLPSVSVSQTGFLGVTNTGGGNLTLRTPTVGNYTYQATWNISTRCQIDHGSNVAPSTSIVVLGTSFIALVTYTRVS